MKLRDIWANLASPGPRQGDGLLRRRLFEDGPIGLFLAVRKPGNVKVLQLSFAGPPPKKSDLPECRGLSVEVVSGAVGEHALEISPRSAEYDDVYTAMVQDLVDQISAAASEVAATELLLSELHRWQRFLETVAPDGLGEIGQQGLFGELHCLRSVFLACGLPKAALKAWTAPGRGLHDFELPHLVCEVKTVGTKAHHKMHIPSEKQLDANGGRILIFCLVVTPNRAEGQTLVEIVNEVRGELDEDPVALRRLEDGLFRWGYLEVHACRYSERRYSIVSEAFYDVRDSFPHLTSADIPRGIGDVSYSIATAACEPFRVPPDQAYALIQEGLSLV